MDEAFAKNKFKVWFAWLIVSLFLAYQYVIRVLPNAIMPYLQEQFHIGASQFGQFSGLYYIGYTLMHIPLGIMLDIIGPRLVVSTCILLVIIGLTPLIYSNSWLLTGTGRVLIGIASSAAILGAFKIIRMGFPSNKFPFILGISVTIGFFGASYGGQLISYSSQIVGLTAVLKFLIITGIGLAILSFFALPGINNMEKKSSNTIKEIKELFSHIKWMIIASLGGLMVGPIEGFADGWATTFLKVAYPNLADYLFVFLPSLILLGIAFGAPIIGLIAEKTQAYYRLIILSGITMCVSFILIFAQINSTPILLIIFFTIGIFSSYQTLVIYKSSTLAPEKFVGLTTACANMVIMIFGYFFHTVIGEVIEMHSVTNNYNFESLVMGILVIPICLFIASCIFIYISIKDNEK
ncbi:MAG: MFS transporter [Rickettsiaceae bacterium H1]|nr:MFS transporter [Rickettsiaceae bacterium H1]